MNTSSDVTTAFWERVLEHVRREMSADKFETWLAPTRCGVWDGEHLAVEVKNGFYASWLRRQYADVIQAGVEAVSGRACSTVEFVVSDAPKHESPAPARRDDIARAAGHRGEGATPKEPERPAARRGLALNPDYTFDNFVVGPSNRLTHAAALAVVEDAGRVYNPLFIHGGVGLGKTHVLQAICHDLLDKRPGLQMLYIPCEQFINQFISALEKNQVEAFRQRYRMLDVLLIDDIHFLANKDHTQEEFFHTFNALYNDQKQIILSSDSPPRDIPTLEERLVSRFKWGLVCELERPTFETRLAIIQQKARLRGGAIPDEVTDFLASSLSSSVRELEGGVSRLLGYARIMNRPVDLETAKAALGDLVGSIERHVTVEDILSLVTDHYGISLSELQSKRRTQDVAVPRQVCMYLARACTPLSLSEIGGYFGGRDHSTVLYAVDKIARVQKVDPKMRSTIEEFERALKGWVGSEPGADEREVVPPETAPPSRGSPEPEPEPKAVHPEVAAPVPELDLAIHARDGSLVDRARAMKQIADAVKTLKDAGVDSTQINSIVTRMLSGTDLDPRPDRRRDEPGAREDPD